MIKIHIIFQLFLFIIVYKQKKKKTGMRISKNVNDVKVINILLNNVYASWHVYGFIYLLLFLLDIKMKIEFLFKNKKKNMIVKTGLVLKLSK